MKARVIATKDIVDVEFSHYIADVAWYKIKGQALYSENELEFIDDPDYWTRLEHQYAGIIVQGMVEHNGINFLNDAILNVAAQKAHALVEKYKKEERK